MTGKPQRRGDPPDPATSPAPFGQFEDARSGGDPAMANATPGAVLALADQLDQAGSTASAHRLYARVASTIAERWPPDRVAKLLAATRDAGSTEATAVLMDAVVHTSGSYSASAAHLAAALVSRGAPELARAFLAQVTPPMPDTEVEALASFLDAGRHRELAVDVLTTAAARRPARTVIEYMDYLRRHGDETAADTLAVTVLTERAELAPQLIQTLRTAGRHAQAEALLDLLMHGDGRLCARVARELRLAGETRVAATVQAGLAARPLIDIVRILTSLDKTEAVATIGDLPLHNRSAGEFVSAIRQLRADGDNRTVEELHSLLIGAAPTSVCAVALGLIDIRQTHDAMLLLERFGENAAPDVVGAAIYVLHTKAPASLPRLLYAALSGDRGGAALISWAHNSRMRPILDRYLGELAWSLSVAAMVRLCARLDAGDVADIADLLGKAAARPDFPALCAALHQAGLHHVAYRLAESSERT